MLCMIGAEAGLFAAEGPLLEGETLGGIIWIDMEILLNAKTFLDWA